MKWLSRLRPSPSMVIAMIALAVALGGTGYAAIVLPANSVGTKQLKKSAVTSVKVKDGSLLNADFKAGQIPAGPVGPAGPAGPGGPAGPAGPSDAFSGFKNGPTAVPGTLSTVATLNVPAVGKYVIVGKAWIFDNVNTGVLVQCQLVAGGDSDETRASLEGNSAGYVTGTSMAFNVAHEFAAAGVIELKCNAFGVSVSINSIKITAIKVGNLTNTGI